MLLHQFFFPRRPPGPPGPPHLGLKQAVGLAFLPCTPGATNAMHVSVQGDLDGAAQGATSKDCIMATWD